MRDLTDSTVTSLQHHQRKLRIVIFVHEPTASSPLDLPCFLCISTSKKKERESRLVLQEWDNLSGTRSKKYHPHSYAAEPKSTITELAWEGEKATPRDATFQRLLIFSPCPSTRTNLNRRRRKVRSKRIAVRARPRLSLPMLLLIWKMEVETKWSSRRRRHSTMEMEKQVEPTSTTKPASVFMTPKKCNYSTILPFPVRKKTMKTKKKRTETSIDSVSTTPASCRPRRLRRRLWRAEIAIEWAIP